MFSVIIPTYKGANYLPRAIDSVLMQDYCDFEIIVVDDNSPDSSGRLETEKVMKRYISSHGNVHYIKHEKNKNGSAARNTGLRSARGDVIAFLDDDDYFLPGRLQKCAIAFSQSDIDIVYSDVLITKDNIPCEYVKAEIEGNLLIDLLINENIMGTGSNLCVRKNVIEKCGPFNEELLRHQDYEFLLRVFECGAKAAVIRECLVVKGMNGVNNGARYEVLRDVKNMLLDRYKNQIASSDCENAIYLNQHKELLHTAIIWKNVEGITEEKEFLKRYGYKYSFLDKIKEMILMSPVKTIIQDIVWKRRSKRVIAENKDVCEKAKNVMSRCIR